ncbi:DUF4153 domain-containing protein [Bowmanella pacifica]|uniref:DUF4153 domain-containing protein n=1 Tax=Bowmanella pacifica TaxID=502051 RepID=A0A917Z4K6_9ALTE|nr:DUF4153 domain-containing protein [Bowmanella pacifica]GGO74247.1 DUF4153 domain-containing protein [Bowmanella pacifica]
MSQNAIPSPLLVLIALLQGLMLLGLHQAMSWQFWPYQDPAWLYALYAGVLTGPLLLLLGLSNTNFRFMLQSSLAFSLVSGLLGYYVGSQASPPDEVGLGILLPALIVTLTIATFKSLMYLQLGIPSLKTANINYSELFAHSWRNFLTMGLALLFSLGIWLLLMLCAALFDAIGLKFFEQLFTTSWFYYPVLSMAMGLGIGLFRRQSGIVDTIVHIQQLLVKWMLVMLVLVSVLFLATLPFTGLAPLWESGGSTLILWMLALLLFFVNATYQHQADPHIYPRWLHRLIYLSLLLMPVYSLISAYGLYMRVAQYGWSVSRCWAVLLWLLLSLFALGYASQILRHKDNWLQGLGRVNIPMGLTVLLAMLLVNSPLLNFMQISANSQMARLSQDKLAADEVDIHYFHSQLAGPGYRALQKIRADYGQTYPELSMRIDALYQKNEEMDLAAFQVQLAKVIEGAESTWPDGLLAAITQHLHEQPWRLAQNQGYYLKAVDLNSDGQQDFLLMEESIHQPEFSLYYLTDDGWQVKSLHLRIAPDTDLKALTAAIKSSDFAVVLPKWQQIRVKGLTLYTEPE